MDGQLLWRAGDERKVRSHLAAFMRQAEARHDVSLPDYDALHRFSVERLDEFWTLVWDYAGIVHQGDAAPARAAAASVFDDTWFPNARLNFAENMLRARTADSEVLVWIGEDGKRRVITYAQLVEEVARCQAALERAGVSVGDRVVGYLPNVPEAVIAMLATVSLGGIWAVVAPDITAQAAIDRIGQLDPMVFVTSDASRHGGRVHDLLAKAEDVAREMPSLRASIVVPHGDGHTRLGSLPYAASWDDFIGGRSEAIPRFRRLPFHAPAFVMFTSGTTGKPKCLVHSSGGVLMQFAKEHLLHADIHEGDRVFRHSTTGWMMWNWATGTLAWKATVVLYDGSPTYPNIDRLFDMAQDERLTYFSPSAALLDIYVKNGLEPGRTHDLSRMRTMYSGGMRVPAAHYAYVYEKIKSDTHFASPSGGTDPMAAFVAGDPTGSVRAGEIACAALAMKVELLDEDGRELAHGPGELVCASPMPSIPLAFWGDPDRSRLIEAYFGRFPGKWSQGDWVERTVHGGYIVHGRSDATIKVRGIRIGTAEIYRPLEGVPEVDSAAAVEQAAGGASRIVLFVKLRGTLRLDAALEDRIRQVLRTQASAHHVPELIAAVPDLPRNSAGKVMEVAVRDVLHGRVPRNLGTVSNPQCLAAFEAFAAEHAAGESP